MLFRKIDRRQLLTAGTALALVGTAPGEAEGAAALYYEARQTNGKPLYTRAELEGFVDHYLDALVAHDPRNAPFAANVVFAENDVVLPLGAASWKTLDRIGRYRHYFADQYNGDVGLIANVFENGQGAILVLRLKIQARQIVEVEQYVTRDPVGADTYEKLGAPDPVWLEPIAPVQRQSHEALQAVAFMYFQALERNDGAGIYPFSDDAVRIEHARRVTSLPAVEGYGHADATFNFTTLSAKAQYELGMMAFVSQIRDRRYHVVDIERGAVLATSFYDYHGDLKSIRFADGRLWQLPSYFRTPRSNHANEAFKIVNGSFRYIEMTFVDVPFGTRAVWSGRKPSVTLEYDPPPPRAAPVKSSHHEDLTGLVGRVLEGLVRHCSCDLPLAGQCRYTENGYEIAPGASGLWRSVTGLRKYRVVLADSERGEAGCLAAIEEHGLFTMIALRLRVVGGYITELETVIARPEKPATGTELRQATFTLFVPPLSADLDPQSFQAPAPALMHSSAGTRQEILTALDHYHEASLKRDVTQARAYLDPSAMRRDNGHVQGDLASGPKATLTSLRGRRSLIIDADQGLALELVLQDNPATTRAAPAEFLVPWTDLHAQLFKVEGGRITHVEELVKRLPYGRDSGWESVSAHT